MPEPHPEDSAARCLIWWARAAPVATVTATWLAAPELRAIYRCRDRDQAAARLYDWTVTCIDSHMPELRRLARSGRDHLRHPIRTQWSDSE